MLTQLQDPALQSILGQNVNTPPPTLKPEEAELYQVFPTCQLSIDRNMSPAIMKPSTFCNNLFLFPVSNSRSHCLGSKWRPCSSSPSSSSQLQPGDECDVDKCHHFPLFTLTRHLVVIHMPQLKKIIEIVSPSLRVGDVFLEIDATKIISDFCFVAGLRRPTRWLSEPQQPHGSSAARI